MQPFRDSLSGPLGLVLSIFEVLTEVDDAMVRH